MVSIICGKQWLFVCRLLTINGINMPRMVLFSLISGFGSPELSMVVAMLGNFFFSIRVMVKAATFSSFPF